MGRGGAVSSADSKQQERMDSPDFCMKHDVPVVLLAVPFKSPSLHQVTEETGSNIQTPEMHRGHTEPGLLAL